MFKAFARSDRGFALVLTLLFLPVFIGVGLLVIDIGRGNNAQSDHQAAADALAIAGARELDGLPSARRRAMEAMQEIQNDVSFLGLSGADTRIELQYTAGGSTPFTVIFLKEIPESDDDPIDQAWVNDNVAETDADAKYVYVFSRSRDLRTFFFNPLTRANENVPVGATAVATLKTVTCDLVPLFMCNPFDDKEEFVDAYEDGDLHGRLIKLRDIPGGGQNSNQVATPGNIGFLRPYQSQDIPPGKALAAALAGVPYPQCIELDDQVETRPGAVNSAWVGFNTRFDVFDTNGNPQPPPEGEPADPTDFSVYGPYTPAKNVRKGWGFKLSGGGSLQNCERQPIDKINPKIDTAAGVRDFYTAFPRMSDNQNADPVFGDFMRAGPWNLNQDVTMDLPNDDIDGAITFPAYWNAVYGRALNATELADMTSRPGFPPSRYDVYRYEVQNDLLDEASNGQPGSGAGAEVGAAQCFQGNLSDEELIDRRTMLIAVVDCDAPPGGVKGNMEVNFDVLAKVFLVNPGATVNGNEGTLDIEIVGITENQGTGEVDEFLRNEVMLVR